MSTAPSIMSTPFAPRGQTASDASRKGTGYIRQSGQQSTNINKTPAFGILKGGDTAYVSGNAYYNYWADTEGFRDKTLKSALSALPKKRDYIFTEIGATRNLSLHARQSDGWATLLFGKFLSDKELKACSYVYTLDVDPAAITSTGRLTQELPLMNTSFIPTLVRDANETLHHLATHRSDFVYLDGSNDPAETKDQFEWTLRVSPSAVIVIDDYQIKGTKIAGHKAMRRLIDVAHMDYEYDEIKGRHEMGIYIPSRKK